MPTGITNLSYSSIFNETSTDVAANTWEDYNFYSWAQGPAPGDGTVAYWGGGVKSGPSENILWVPYVNGAFGGITSDFNFGLYKNYYAYMDQSVYGVRLTVNNMIPPATRPDPPNDFSIDVQLFDKNFTSNSICGIGAGNVPENGGTFGPTEQSQPYTFNVAYFYIAGYFANQGFDPYTINLFVQNSLEYNTPIGGGLGPQAIDYTMFFGVPVNNGSGFDLQIDVS
jgi:hypothetical protein